MVTEEQYFRLWNKVKDSSGSLDSIQIRKPHVHDDEVRLQLPCSMHGLQSIRYGCDNLEPWFFFQGRTSIITPRCVVIHDDNPYQLAAPLCRQAFTKSDLTNGPAPFCNNLQLGCG